LGGEKGGGNRGPRTNLEAVDVHGGLLEVYT